MRTAMGIATVLTVGTAVVGGMGASLVLLAIAPVVGVGLFALSKAFDWE